MRPPRVLLVFVAVVLVMVVAGCAAPAPAPTSVPSAGPLAVLHAWDEQRAAAWAAGDPAGLARLYAPGSRAGARDVRLLREYRARGYVVTGMRMQVLRARVLVRRPDLIRVEVVDRLASAVAVSTEGGRTRLPRDLPTRRTIELRRLAGSWRVARVATGQS